MAYGYSERSLPYIHDASQYHQYEIVGDFTKIDEYVKNCKDDNILKQVYEAADRYYGGDCSKFCVYKGTAAQIPGWGDGGATQYEFPISMEVLEGLGLIREIK